MAVAFVLPHVLNAVASLARDGLRYDRMRRMSNEGPLIAQVPAMAGGIAHAESGALGDLGAMFASIPKAAWRYLRIKSM